MYTPSRIYTIYRVYAYIYTYTLYTYTLYCIYTIKQYNKHSYSYAHTCKHTILYIIIVYTTLYIYAYVLYTRYTQHISNYVHTLIHTLGISMGLACHSSNCTSLILKSFSHDDNGRIDGQARFCHVGGILSKNKLVFKVSMASLIVNSPAKPSCSSLSDLIISYNNVFITSISCMNTF